MKKYLYLLMVFPSLALAETYYPTGPENFYSRQNISGTGESDISGTIFPCDRARIIQTSDREVDIQINCDSNTARISGELNSNNNIGDSSYIVILKHIDTANGLGGGQSLGSCIVTKYSLSCNGSNLDQSWDFKYELRE